MNSDNTIANSLVTLRASVEKIHFSKAMLEHHKKKLTFDYP